MIEASDTTIRKLDGDGISTTGSNGPMFLAGNESEYARTVKTNTHTNDKTLQVADVIYSDSESDEGSNCCMEDSDYMVDDE